MKFSFFKKTLAAVAGCLFLCAGQAQAIVINFSSQPNAVMAFDGSTDTFSFQNPLGTDVGPANDFHITTVVGGGASVGLLGNITGSFNILSPITSTVVPFVGTAEHAYVSGAGTITIFDGLFTFNADVQWIDIFTLGGAGATNSGINLNLSNFVYGGSNADLLALMADGQAVATISFQFASGTSLTSLTTGVNTQFTSYSGTLATPDGGSMLAMFGAALIGVGVLRRKLKA